MGVDGRTDVRRLNRASTVVPFAQVLEQLHSGFEVILVDCPSALSVADALVIANLADATLLVLAAMATRSAAASRASMALGRSGTRLLGVVLNRAPVDRDGYPPAVRPPAAAPPQAGGMAGQARAWEQ